METKNHIVLILLIGTSLWSFSQTVKTKTYIENPKGKRVVLKIEEFDRNGHLIKEAECINKSCSKADVQVFVYNEKEQLVVDSFYTNKFGYHHLIQEYEYSYYSNGNLKTEKTVNRECPDGFNDLNTFFYNSKGQLIKVYNENACSF